MWLLFSSMKRLQWVIKSHSWSIYAMIYIQYIWRSYYFILLSCLYYGLFSLMGLHMTLSCLLLYLWLNSALERYELQDESISGFFSRTRTHTCARLPNCSTAVKSSVSFTHLLPSRLIRLKTIFSICSFPFSSFAKVDLHESKEVSQTISFETLTYMCSLLWLT